MNVLDLYAKIVLDTGDYEKGLEDASGKTSYFADKLKTGLATAAKVGAAGLAAAAAGVAALTKASIEQYGEYEQLVGGVETLFKASSDVVQQYAANAYKTAGMSANEYMETVTSFSASLLQSLDGDTAAAAEKADLAITDMSDNANKMGTSMESIQNAYQGFAKQNFTMLDNLKLGYGGTKEEMQRLLEDAEKISGIEYDVSSYADIVDAIHVVQTEMGITGTTAQEASSTIQGSVSSMNSAWANLVTGIATDNADIDVLLDNFFDSVETVADNILPVVERILTNIFDTLAERGPDMLAAAIKLFMQIVAGALKTLPDIVASIPKIIEAIVNGFLDGVPSIAEAGEQLLTGLWNGISDKVEWLKGKVSGVVDTIKGWFTGKDGFDEHSPSKWSKQVFRYVMDGGGEGLDAGLPGLMQSVGSVTDRVKSGLDFGTASVDFASSGLGVSSAGIINSMGYGRSGSMSVPGSIELKLTSEDGQIFGRWMVPFIRSEDKSNPEVVSDAV